MVNADVRLLTDVVTRLRRALRASIRTDIPWERLPVAQVELLASLDEHGGSRIGELAGRLHLAPNTVSTLVQQLVDAGLMERSPDPADRRAVRISLSDTGRAQLGAWQDGHEERLGRALEALAPDDRARIVAALPALGLLVEHLTRSG